MTRKSLKRDIQRVNLGLALKQAQFRYSCEQSTQALKQVNPFVLIGVGLFAGVVANAIGLRQAYSAASAGFSFYPLIMNNVNYVMGLLRGE